MKQNYFITFTNYVLWLLEIERTLLFQFLIFREMDIGSHNNVNNLYSPDLEPRESTYFSWILRSSLTRQMRNISRHAEKWRPFLLCKIISKYYKDEVYSIYALLLAWLEATSS
jgi:hypothetical protein